MAYVSDHNQFALDLCDTLGLDPKITRSITINVSVGNLVTVDITQYNTDDRFSGLLKLLKPYKLFKYVLAKNRDTDE